MADMTQQAQRLRNILQQCHGFDGDEISKAREMALKYYFQRKRGDEVDGRSDVVSGDVSAMVEATVAQWMEAFSSDRICDFDPMDADDETQAALESEAVQYYVMGRENGFLEMMAASKEAALFRNGLICCDAEDRTTRRVRTFSNVDPDAIGELTSGDDVVDFEYDQEAGDLVVTLEVTRREFKMESIPLENFLYYADWHKHTLEGIPVCAVRHVDTRASLVALGVDKKKVEGLTAHHSELKTESQARNPKDSKHSTLAYDDSQELVEWYDVYMRQDAGGVDELRRIKFSYQDAVVLQDKPCPFINLASGTAILNPHRFTGISLFDKLKQNQDIRTQLRRALLDNVNATTKNRLAGLDGVVNEDDATSGRVNNLVRVKNVVPDVRQAIMALQVPDTSANILANLESTAKERSEMGGAALDLQTAQMQIGGDRMGSQGLDRAYSVAEQLSAAMMKTLAATLIRSTFLVAHKVLREYFDEELPIKRNGKWTYVKPSEWPERHSVTVKPGMSPGERSRRVAALGQVLDAQMMMADRGMDEVLVDLHSFNRTLLDWARMAEVQNPEQYFIDPDSDQAKAALQAKDQQRQLEQRNRAMLMQQSFGMEQLRQAVEKYRHDSELQFKYFAEVLGAEKVEAQEAGKATLELLKGKLGNGQREPGNQDGGSSAGQGTEGQQTAATGAGSQES